MTCYRFKCVSICPPSVHLIRRSQTFHVIAKGVRWLRLDGSGWSSSVAALVLGWGLKLLWTTDGFGWELPTKRTMETHIIFGMEGCEERDMHQREGGRESPANNTKAINIKRYATCAYFAYKFIFFTRFDLVVFGVMAQDLVQIVLGESVVARTYGRCKKGLVRTAFGLRRR